MAARLGAEDRLADPAERRAHAAGFGRLDQHDADQQQREHHHYRIEKYYKY